MDKKCPFTGNVSIRGRILTGVVKSMKMKRTIVIRRDYLHYIKKYKRFEKRHKNISVHMSPCFRCAVERGRVCVCVCACVCVRACGGEWEWGWVCGCECVHACVCAVCTCTCLCVYVIELGLFTLEPNVHWKISHPMHIEANAHSKCIESTSAQSTSSGGFKWIEQLCAHGTTPDRNPRDASCIHRPECTCILEL